MPFFSFDARTQDISIRLGALKFCAVRGTARVPAKYSPKYPGELAFDVLGATAYLLNHHRMNAHSVSLSL